MVPSRPTPQPLAVLPRLGLLLQGGGGRASLEALTDVAVRAEAAGFDGLWATDGIDGIDGADQGRPVPAGERLDPFTVLGALAVRTSRVRLAALGAVTAALAPALLAKTVTTLDRLSAGRAVLVLDATAVEAAALRRAVAVCRGSFDGSGVVNLPRPVRPEGPEIVVDCTSAPEAVPVAAGAADACIVPGAGTAEARSVLDAGAGAPGTRPALLALVAVDGDPGTTVSEVGALYRAGADGVVLRVTGGLSGAQVDALGRALSRRDPPPVQPAGRAPRPSPRS